MHGRKAWWFVPPQTRKFHQQKLAKVNACDYLRTGAPTGAVMCVQQPGEIMYFPKDWQHATCMLDEWNIAVGAQARSQYSQSVQHYSTTHM